MKKLWIIALILFWPLVLHGQPPDGLYFDENGFYQVENGEVELYFPEAWPIEETVVTVEKDPQGRTKKWTEIRRHKLTGQQKSKRQDDYTYYPTGEVDIIDQKELDEADEVKHEKEIKHYKDGRQPKVTIIK